MSFAIKKACKLAMFAYGLSLPVAFVVGGLVYTRPVRSPLKPSALTSAMLPEWGDAFRRDQRELRIPVTPHVRFAATVFGGDSAVCVLVLHSSGGTRLETLPLAYKLWKLGLGVVLLDRKAHGSSEGEAQPLFLREQEDLVAVVDWLINENVVGTSAIGVLGVGDGGTSALLLAARDPRIDAVAAIDPVVDARDYVTRRLAATTPLPRLLLAPHAELAVRAMVLFSGATNADSRARAALGEVKAPVLILAANGKDERSDASAVCAALFQAKVERIEAGPEEDGYDGVASFLRRSL